MEIGRLHAGVGFRLQEENVQICHLNGDHLRMLCSKKAMGIRTSVVLDEDVLERVLEQAREEHVPFRNKLNDLFRQSLSQTKLKPRVPLDLKPRDLGSVNLPHPIRLSDIDAMEDEERYCF
jgi:hypothetical protein